MSILSKSIVSGIFSAFKGEAQAVAKARVNQDKAIQIALDTMRAACNVPKADFMKGNSVKNPARAEVKVIFDGLVEAGYIGKSAGANYQTSFWIAFEQGIDFQRDLFKSNKPASEAKEPKAKAGKIESTDRKALDTTLSKAIKQARLLGLTEFAADIVDLCLEALDDFKEAE